MPPSSRVTSVVVLALMLGLTGLAALLPMHPLAARGPRSIGGGATAGTVLMCALLMAALLVLTLLVLGVAAMICMSGGLRSGGGRDRERDRRNENRHCLFS